MYCAFSIVHGGGMPGDRIPYQLRSDYPHYSRILFLFPFIASIYLVSYYVRTCLVNTVLDYFTLDCSQYVPKSIACFQYTHTPFPYLPDGRRGLTPTRTGGIPYVIAGSRYILAVKAFSLTYIHPRRRRIPPSSGLLFPASRRDRRGYFLDARSADHRQRWSFACSRTLSADGTSPAQDVSAASSTPIACRHIGTLN